MLDLLSELDDMVDASTRRPVKNLYDSDFHVPRTPISAPWLVATPIMTVTNQTLVSILSGSQGGKLRRTDDTPHDTLREHVAQLHRNYCVFVDDCRIDELVGLFATTAHIDYGPKFSATGHDAMRTLFTSLRTSCEQTSHHVSNIDVDPATLTGCAYVMAWHRFAGGQPDLVVYGRYIDEFTTENGVLVIARRTLRTHGATMPMPFNPLERASG